MTKSSPYVIRNFIFLIELRFMVIQVQFLFELIHVGISKYDSGIIQRLNRVDLLSMTHTI